MSDEQDVSIASDQEQVDDQLNDEDAGGLFGSGSEDEQSGYEVLIYYHELKLTFVISVPRALVTNVVNLMIPSSILETMKADSIALKMASMDTARNRRCTIAWQISWIYLLAVTLSRNPVTARYGVIQNGSTKGSNLVLILAIALPAPIAQLHWHQPRRLHFKELQTSDHRSSLRSAFVHFLSISDIQQHHTLEALT